MTSAWPSLSVVIPAFNEEAYLARTVAHLRRAEALLRQVADAAVEFIVVDNDSTDRTREVARDLGLVLVKESEHNIARVRNAGARAAVNDVLVFVDADTLVPPEVLLRIAEIMSDPTCDGGAIDARFQPRRRLVRAYLRLTWLIGSAARMAMGACHFARRDTFTRLGGYDETIFMGEDVDFMWRLSAQARRHGQRARIVRDLHVITSSRRFDTWPLWKILLMTHPAVAFGLRRRKAAWRDWYDPGRLPR